MTPVATSATLGDKNDPSRILTFARTVFGADFDDNAVVTESRYSVDEWARLPGAEVSPKQADLVPLGDLKSVDTGAAVEWIERTPTSSDEESAIRAFATIFRLGGELDDESPAGDSRNPNGLRRAISSAMTPRRFSPSSRDIRGCEPFSKPPPRRKVSTNSRQNSSEIAAKLPATISATSSLA